MPKSHDGKKRENLCSDRISRSLFTRTHGDTFNVNIVMIKTYDGIFLLHFYGVKSKRNRTTELSTKTAFFMLMHGVSKHSLNLSHLFSLEL